ncbi:cysteine--tRNA ligase [Svornostia abyssi]|uniref:Cysteine--tRNA ligase n=1 Tax=Svornostia abyssi TaxID=2898438 RepID=A0ABY5PF82_9ACTN|nr:cysteine--tRNA ligase [Parviterribacteraceae bacterium J379]
MRTISLHDTRTGRLTEVRPREPGKIGIYACGPTVYARIHIGNARPFVVFSLLRRFLRSEGYEATLVINVTDVNDKIYDAAKAQGIASADLACDMTSHYVADTNLLGLGRPDHEPLAGETVGGMIDLIEALIARGHAYAAEGDVYFRVRSDPAYGELSHRDLDAMDQGEDVEGTRLKEDPLDFALWKATKPGEDTSWASPWGQGRPGWHIECSAMAEEYLGVGFEIHGGGSDLVFPHHENEAAQTRCGRGHELTQVWMHSGLLLMGTEKMAKSVGNVALLHEVAERWGRDTLIWFFCTGHYRRPLSFDDDTLEAARSRVARIRDQARRLADGPSPAEMGAYRERFFDELADDFNTPQALAELGGWLSEANRRLDAGEEVGNADLRAMLDVLHLANLLDAPTGGGPAPEDLALLESRQAARAAKDWAEADRLRDELRARGWEVRDGAGGAELVPVAS